MKVIILESFDDPTIYDYIQLNLFVTFSPLKNLQFNNTYYLQEHCFQRTEMKFASKTSTAIPPMT